MANQRDRRRELIAEPLRQERQGNMLERAVVVGVVAVVVMRALASTLPRITPSLAVLGVLVLMARVVWWYTR